MTAWVNAATRGWVTEGRLLGACLALGALQLAYLAWIAWCLRRASLGRAPSAYPFVTLLVPAGTEVAPQDYPGELELVPVAAGVEAALAGASPRSELLVWAGARVDDPGWLAAAAAAGPTHVWDAGEEPRPAPAGAFAALRSGSETRLFVTAHGPLPPDMRRRPARLNGQGMKWGVLARNVRNYLPLGLLVGAPAQVYLLYLILRGPWAPGLAPWWAAVHAAQLAAAAALAGWVAFGRTTLLVKAFSDAVVRPVLESYTRFMWGVLGRDIPTGASVVDVGAASGLLSDLMARVQGGRQRAVDVAPWTMGKVPVEWYDGRTLPLADGEADVAVCVTVLHHCPDPEAVLKELRRVCRRLVIVEDRGEGALERFGHRLWHVMLEVVLRMPYNAEGFAGLEGWRERLGRAGFKVVSSREVPYHLAYSVLLVIVAE